MTGGGSTSSTHRPSHGNGSAEVWSMTIDTLRKMPDWEGVKMRLDGMSELYLNA